MCSSDLLRREIYRLVGDDPQLAEIIKNGNGSHENLDEKWFGFVNSVSNKVLGQFANHVMDSLAGAQFLDLFHALGSAGTLYSVLAPYFVAFSIDSEDRRFAGAVLDRFIHGEPNCSRRNNMKIANFTDTF